MRSAGPPPGGGRLPRTIACTLLLQVRELGTGSPLTGAVPRDPRSGPGGAPPRPRGAHDGARPGNGWTATRASFEPGQASGSRASGCAAPLSPAMRRVQESASARSQPAPGGTHRQYALSHGSRQWSDGTLSPPGPSQAFLQARRSFLHRARRCSGLSCGPGSVYVGCGGHTGRGSRRPARVPLPLRRKVCLDGFPAARSERATKTGAG